MATKTPATEAPAYILDEAHELVAELAEKLRHDVAAKGDAAQRLLDVLPSLDRPGVTIQKRTDGDKLGTWIMANDKKRLLVVGVGGEIFAQKEKSSGSTDEQITGLRYNPTTKLLEGVAVDSRFVPADGARRVQQRGAAAVVVEQVTEMLLRAGKD